MAGQRLSVRVPDDLYQRLCAAAQITGKSESKLVRDAIEEHCSKHLTGPTCYDIASAAGLIGCATDLPTDLSTNPRYMQGFGSD